MHNKIFILLLTLLLSISAYADQTEIFTLFQMDNQDANKAHKQIKRAAKKNIRAILGDDAKLFGVRIKEVDTGLDQSMASLRALLLRKKPKKIKMLTLEMVREDKKWTLTEKSIQAILQFVNNTTKKLDGLAVATVEDPENAFVSIQAVASANDILRLTNQERSKKGLKPLRLNGKLNKAAQNHARDMANRGYFSHTSQDGRSPFDRMRNAGYKGSYMGENIAAGYSTAQKTMTGWMNSPGHRKNILNANYTELGVGIVYNKNSKYKYYWVQNFGKPK